MTEYTDNFISTYTGKHFHFLNPQPDEISLADIAHQLALTNRFNGCTTLPYSVAEHSIRVASILPKQYMLEGLFHDAHEAYLHDVARPIKPHIAGYKEIALIVQSVIEKKFGIKPTAKSRKEVKLADDILLATEARDLMAENHGWEELPTPLNNNIYPRNWEMAEFMFVSLYNQLDKRRV
jgi:hypothetical protein